MEHYKIQRRRIWYWSLRTYRCSCRNECRAQHQSGIQKIHRAPRKICKARQVHSPANTVLHHRLSGRGAPCVACERENWLVFVHGHWPMCRPSRKQYDGGLAWTIVWCRCSNVSSAGPAVNSDSLLTSLSIVTSLPSPSFMLT